MTNSVKFSDQQAIVIEINANPRITVADPQNTGPMTAQAQEELMSSLKILFTEGVWSDLTINCGTDTHKVHKAILCPRSAFFQKACSGGLFKEGETGVIDLPEDDPIAVKMMIHYMYHLDYPHQPNGLFLQSTPDTQGGDINGSGLTTAAASWLTSKPGLTPIASPSAPGFTSVFAPKTAVFGSPSPLISFASPPAITGRPAILPCSNLTIHAKVYALAEKYGIPTLKAVALDKFKYEAGYFWLAHDFLHAAEEVYTSTVEQDRGLRDIVVETIHQHPTMLNSKATQDVIKNNQDLNFDMLMYVMKWKGSKGYRE